MGMDALINVCCPGVRVMKKRCAGFLWSGVVIFLLGVWGAGAEPESPGEQPVPSFKAKVESRIAELKSATVEEMEQAVLRSEALMIKLNEEARALRMALRDLQEQMRAENPEVRAKYREIEEMRARINAFIDELPEVKAQLDVLGEAEARLLEEVWFRTEAQALVAERDRAAGFPERPEPVLNETEEPAGEEPAAAGEEPAEDLEP
jgi:hypothetical protein